MKSGANKKYYFLILITVLSTLTFAYGVLVGYRKYPPFELIQAGYMRFLKTEYYNEVGEEYQDIDPRDLISITNSDDVVKKRMDLIKFIWGEQQDGLPSLMPANIERNIIDERFSNLSNLDSIDRITVDMELGFNSIVYHFHHSSPDINRRLVIYHQGHEGDFIAGKDTIQFFLNEGYSVAAFTMPGGGMNSNPVIYSKVFGNIKFSRHDDFKFMALSNGSPIKFFVHPIAEVLNYIEKEFDYKDISMIGISGGGWTTVLYSAFDSRISKSYSVAGSLPIYLRDLSFEGGDYEQILPELYRTVNYLELYILGSYGEGRGQLQVFNKYDSCCFAGVKYKAYEKEIKNIISDLGAGYFDVFLDDTHREHKISEAALKIIINDLKR